MNENYIVINGKRAELTNEQLRALGIEVRKNPFTVEEGDQYWCANSFAGVDSHIHTQHKDDKSWINACNAFNDSSFANQIALHQLLYRKLLKFAYEQGYEDVAEWNCCNLHYRIHYTYGDNKFDVANNDVYKNQGAVYFATQDGAECAIKEVVEPFVKEHPEFVW